MQSKADVVQASWGANRRRGWRDRPGRGAGVSRTSLQPPGCERHTTSNNGPETSSFMRRQAERGRRRGQQRYTERAVPWWVSQSQPDMRTLAETTGSKSSRRSLPGLAHSTPGRNWIFGRGRHRLAIWIEWVVGRRAERPQLRSGGARLRGFGLSSATGVVGSRVESSRNGPNEGSGRDGWEGLKRDS